MRCVSALSLLSKFDKIAAHNLYNVTGMKVGRGIIKNSTILQEELHEINHK
jgi:hypothetical protein